MSTGSTSKPRVYKGFTPRMGVFAVRHLPSGRTLLGWSIHLAGILNRHRFQLDAGSHPLKTLQADWRRDGPEAFTFEVVDELAANPAHPADFDYRGDLAALEALWRDRLDLTAQTTYRT
jgi:hypothetical protein